MCVIHMPTHYTNTHLSVVGHAMQHVMQGVAGSCSLLRVPQQHHQGAHQEGGKLSHDLPATAVTFSGAAAALESAAAAAAA